MLLVRLRHHLRRLVVRAVPFAQRGLTGDAAPELLLHFLSLGVVPSGSRKPAQPAIDCERIEGASSPHFLKRQSSIAEG